MSPDPSHLSYFQSKILQLWMKEIINEYNIFDYHKRSNMIFIVSDNGSQVSYRIFAYNKRSNMIHGIGSNCVT